MTADAAVLVLGATGRQGGATVRHLLARGRHVHALVRDPADPAAAALTGLGAELVQGNLDDPASLQAAVAGVDGVFCVLPYQPGQPEREVAQGTTVGDAAAAAGVARLVYSSVAGADRGIGIPETDSKWAIEQHLADLELPVTVLRPTFLMENFDIPELKQAIMGGSLYFAMAADTRLQLVAADDVGALAALAFDDPAAVGSPTEIAGEEMPMAEVAATFGRFLGRPVQYVAMPYESAAQFDPNLATLGAWLDREGYRADLPALRRLRPGLLTLDAWLRRTHWAADTTKHMESGGEGRG